MRRLKKGYVAPHIMKRALRERHIDDSFFTEVRNGRSNEYGVEVLIMDAVAIRRSWANPCITAYEIKSSRSDFLADEKWRGYMQYCNEFAFVCPKGMIAQAELPDDVGLVYYNSEKDSLWTCRRGKYREIEPPVDMFRYLIMRWDNQKHPFFNSTREYCEEYVKDKVDKRRIGHVLGTKMAEELERARSKIEALERRFGLPEIRRRKDYLKEIMCEKMEQEDITDFTFWRTLEQLIETGNIHTIDIDYDLRQLTSIVGRLNKQFAKKREEV